MLHTLSAKSYLFVPAIDIHRVPKAFARGADAVIIDLEDAVSESVKIQSRQNVVDYLSSADAKPVWVRINASNAGGLAGRLSGILARLASTFCPVCAALDGFLDAGAAAGAFFTVAFLAGDFFAGVLFARGSCRAVAGCGCHRG